MAKNVQQAEPETDETDEGRTRQTQYREVVTVRIFAHKDIPESKLPNIVAGLEAHAKTAGLGIRNRATAANGNLSHTGKSGITSLAFETPESMERFQRIGGPSREVRDYLARIEAAGKLSAVQERAKASGLTVEDWIKQTLEAAKASALGL